MIFVISWEKANILEVIFHYTKKININNFIFALHNSLIFFFIFVNTSKYLTKLLSYPVLLCMFDGIYNI